MQGWFHGYRDALVKCRLTPGGISSSWKTGRIVALYMFFDKRPQPLVYRPRSKTAEKRAASWKYCLSEGFTLQVSDGSQL